jgi:hypothetical protein
MSGGRRRKLCDWLDAVLNSRGGSFSRLFTF